MRQTICAGEPNPERFNEMSTTIVVQSPMAPPSLAEWGKRWHLSESPEQQEPEDVGWSFETPAEVAYQYDLFERHGVESEEFQELVEGWHIERGTRSSTTEIVLCAAYQAIIGMGPRAIPLILAQMEAEGEHPDQWFWALQVLTKADPVKEEDEGNFRKMARAWLEWARLRYVW